MTDLSLPKSFEALEPLVTTWALATQDQRQQRRIRSSRGELRAFYDAMLPRLPDILTHVDTFPLGELPPASARLFHLALSLAEVAPHIELYGRPEGALQLRRGPLRRRPRPRRRISALDHEARARSRRPPHPPRGHRGDPRPGGPLRPRRRPQQRPGHPRAAVARRAEWVCDGFGHYRSRDEIAAKLYRIGREATSENNAANPFSLLARGPAAARFC